MMFARKHPVRLFTALLIASGIVISPSPSVADVPWIAPPIEYREMDTLFIDVQFGPHAATVLFGPDNKKDFTDAVCVPVDRAFRSLFSSMPGITLYSRDPDCAPAPERARTDIERHGDDGPRTMTITFLVSAHDKIVNGQHVKTAALSVDLSKFLSGVKERINYSSDPVTYPFAVPESKEELKQKLADGVRYLAGSFPFYFCDSAEKDRRYLRKDRLCPAEYAPGYWWLSDDDRYVEKLPSAVTVNPPPLTPEQRQLLDDSTP